MVPFCNGIRLATWRRAPSLDHSPNTGPGEPESPLQQNSLLTGRTSDLASLLNRCLLMASNALPATFDSPTTLGEDMADGLHDLETVI